MTQVHDGATMRAARHRLGMSVGSLGLALGLGNGCARRAGRAVRKYESDDPSRPVSPAIAAAIADLELAR